MEKKMKTIKKYWIYIVSAIAAALALIFISKKQTEIKTDKIKQKIDDNDKQVDQLQGKIDVVEEQRNEIKTQISEHEQLIENLEERKETVTADVLEVAEAKENIINKTKRGRKPNKNKKS
jgi:uncharacterized protein YoxC